MVSQFDQTKILLVTGQARSGTTILTKCIAAHPDVHSTGLESNVINDVANASMRGSTMPDRKAQMVVSREQYHCAFRRLLLDILWPEELVWQNGFTDKSPPAALSTFSSLKVENADELLNIFPELHIACIVRNGIEVVASRMNHEHIGKLPFVEHCVAWSRSVEMAMWGHDKNCFTLIRHENLLQRDTAEAEFDRLFKRAGLTLSAAPLETLFKRHHHRTSVPGEPEADRQDMTKRNNRWQYWTEDQQKQFIEICGNAMNFFSYLMPAK